MPTMSTSTPTQWSPPPRWGRVRVGVKRRQAPTQRYHPESAGTSRLGLQRATPHPNPPPQGGRGLVVLSQRSGVQPWQRGAAGLAGGLAQLARRLPERLELVAVRVEEHHVAGAVAISGD